ncbi:MAG: site-2 protease family protein [Anaerovoracaceae bacterium]
MKRFFNNPLAIFLIIFMVYKAFMGGRYDNPMDWIMEMMYLLPGIVIGLSFHEFAHAFAACLCGDETPRLQGRVTLNPMAHIDPIGFIALFLIGFGWGRPVEINPGNFKKPRVQELIVALAGVVTNLLIALMLTGLLRILYQFQLTFMLSEMGTIIHEIIIHGIQINIILMIFNLLPIPPLDGFNVITQIFNLRNTRLYYEIYDKGFLILMIFIIFNLTGRILWPIFNFVYGNLINLFF